MADEKLTPMENILEVDRVLEEARKQDFESVVVFGFKEGRAYPCKCSTTSRFELMGILFAALMETYGATVADDEDEDDDA